MRNCGYMGDMEAAHDRKEELEDIKYARERGSVLSCRFHFGIHHPSRQDHVVGEFQFHQRCTTVKFGRRLSSILFSNKPNHWR